MQGALLNPYDVGQASPPGLAGGVTAVEAVLHHSSRLTAQEHLLLYQRSYVARLRGCMAQQFSALEYALGADLFRAFADDYLAATPSTHYNLAELGRLFPAYLQANRPDALHTQKEDWIDFIIELAAFEYAISELFDRHVAEDYRLAEAGDADDQIGLVPACAPFQFQFPINTFYTQFKKGENPDLPFTVPSHCIVVRTNYKLALYDAQPEHYAFLKLLAQGMTAAAAKNLFIQRNKLDANAFARLWPVWKQNWVAHSLLKVVVA